MLSIYHSACHLSALKKLPFKLLECESCLSRGHLPEVGCKFLGHSDWKS